ncbi:MAG: DUF2971 domain-containing protein, partial [Gaiellaceae bacterium]
LLGIIKEGALWATNIHFLNDASELTEPLRIAHEELKYQLDNGKILEEEYKKNIDLIITLMEFADSSFYNMFVASFCTEDDILSQWRGYGMFGSAYAMGFDIQKLIETIEKNNFELRHCQYENRKDYTQIIKDYIPKFIESTIKMG